MRASAAAQHRPRGPRLAWHRRVPRPGGGAFACLVLASAAGCAALAWALGRDAVIAAQARAEKTASTLAERLAAGAASPGADLAATLPLLSAAAGPGVRIAVLEQSGEAGAPWHIVGHGNPARSGTILRDDRKTEALLGAAQARRNGPGAASLVREDGPRLDAAALVSGDPAAAAVVLGVAREPPGGRPFAMAVATLLLLVAVGAALAEVFPRAGSFLNAALLAAVLAAATRLGAALQPGLWRGDSTQALAVRATDLRMTDLARALAVDLPAPPSVVETRALPICAGAVALYLLAIGGGLSLAARVAGSSTRHLRRLAPAAGALLLCGLVPLAYGIAPAIRAGVPAASRIAQGAAAAGTSLAWAGGVALLAVAAGTLIALGLRGVQPAARRAWIAVMFVPWALPWWVGALSFRTAIDHVGAGSVAEGAAAAVLAAAWIGFPPVLLLVDRALDHLSAELFDALRQDGLGPMVRLRVIVPMLKPVLSAAAAAEALWAFGLLAVPALVAPGTATADTLPMEAFRAAFDGQDAVLAAWLVAAVFVAAAGWTVVAMRRAALAPALRTRPARPADTSVAPARTAPGGIAWLPAAVAAAAVLSPVAWLALLAFADAGSAPWTIAGGAGVENFARVAGRLGTGGHWLFGRQLLNSAVVSAGCAIVVAVVSAGGGWALSRARWRWAGALRGAWLAMALLPAAVVAAPAAALLVRAGLDAAAVLALVQCGTAVPLGTWVVAKAFDRVGQHSEELSRLDGLADGTAFHRVLAPQVRGAVAAAGALAFAAAWNEWLLSSHLARGGEARTLGAAVAAYATGPDAHPGAFAAGALVVAVPSLVALYAARRHVPAALGME